MKKKNILFLLAALALFGVMFLSCDKDDEPDYNSTLTATIDGVPFTATDFAFSIINDSITSVTGWNVNQYIRFKLLNVDTPGIYTVPADDDQSLGFYSVDGQLHYYVADEGWVEITQNTAERIQGTFDFTIELSGGPPDNIFITDGAFNVSKMEKFN